ncbi:MAG TPA: prephenate dehydrogenase [Clostridia bacterium]|jgi:prephenate dehydrogenase|nr:prephenate dehydrogenase [Clostridia bacterium]
MKAGIIGLGLIGGSLARALKRAGYVVYGSDISEEVMLKAELLNAIDARLSDENLAETDLLFIAVYPRGFGKVLESVAPHLKNGAVVLDIAGIKRPIVDAMKKTAEKYPNLNFVATHPMAGREYWGISHSTASLFDKASLLMVPVKADIADLVAAKKAFTDAGCANVVVTNAQYHDKMIAYTSQLAHLVSSSYVKSPTAESHDGYSAGSFRDLTRVAKLNARMWTELIFDNRDNVIIELDTMIENLTKYRDALNEGDENRLCELLAEGNERKDRIEKASREWKRIRNESN